MKTVKANIKPALLTWARESLGFSLADAAKRLDVTEDRLRSWEFGEDRPTINQLRKMTEVYKRPLAVFFLPEPPKGFQVMKDFRRMPGTIAGLYSPQLLLEIRRAQERRQLALDLLAEIDVHATNS
jgi:transcriptional regulator with XRE-family HTH domain